MVSDFRATLYDLFGYLIPGTVATVAAVLLWHGVFSGTPYVELPHPHSLGDWAPFLFVSYLAGHVVQGIANIVPWIKRGPESSALGDGGIPSDLVKLARSRIGNRLGVDADSLGAAQLAAMIDEYPTDSLGAANREVYIYREGFYRGMAVGTGLLILGLAFYMGDQLCSPSSGGGWCMSQPEVYATLVSCIVCCAIFLRRMRRFGRYRIERSLYRFLLATNPEPERNPEEPG